MLKSLLLLVAAFFAYRIFASCRQFYINLRKAKQSGLPYIWTPIYTFNQAWLVTHQLWMPLLRALPASWTHPWIHYLVPDYIWDRKYDTYKEVGSDLLLIVSPGDLTLMCADADAMAQMTTRRNDFPKPTERYDLVDIFGKNVVSTEGAYWRHHRKITSPPFNEKSNVLVWQESLHQAQSMMAGWMKDTPNDSGPLKTIASEAMRLSLHVISRAGFGVRLDWPHEESERELPEGHTLSYKDALSNILENIIVVMLTPTVIMEWSPLKLHKRAQEAYVEWGKYMTEMYHAKRDQIKAGETTDGLDLMGALVKGAGLTTESLNASDPADAEKQQKQILTDDEILGNAFVFILAGHETAANTIHFCILYLAMRLASQRRLQADLDAILGDRPVAHWDYDADVPRLFGSMCGAVMNEQLRLIPPVTGIPKCTLPGHPQGLQFDDRRVTVPDGTYVTLDTVGVHRNPKYWPCTSEEDLNAFRPERWLLDDANSNSANSHTDEPTTHHHEEDLDFDGPDKRPDTAPSLFRPPRGAYLPFSEGHRSCLGRRFAQVEILAVLAVVFKHYSVELDLSDYISEGAEVRESEVQAAYAKAQARAQGLLDWGMGTVVTIQMRKGKVPMRFVKRGCERVKVT